MKSESEVNSDSDFDYSKGYIIWHGKMIKLHK